MTKSDRVRPRPTESDGIQQNPTKFDQIRPNPTEYDLIRPSTTKSDQDRPSTTKSDRIRRTLTVRFSRGSFWEGIYHRKSIRFQRIEYGSTTFRFLSVPPPCQCNSFMTSEDQQVSREAGRIGNIMTSQLAAIPTPNPTSWSAQGAHSEIQTTRTQTQQHGESSPTPKST